MGRQINFYLHPNDYQSFEDLLKASGEVVFLLYYHYNNVVKTVQSTISGDIIKEGSKVYIIRRQNLNKVKLWHVEKFGYWLVHDTNLPVLHYDRCRFDNNKIIKDRLYFETKYVHDMQLVDKPVDFINWADNIIKKARRQLTRCKFDMGGWGFSEYVGRHTIEWFDKMKKENSVNDTMLISGN